MAKNEKPKSCSFTRMLGVAVLLALVAFVLHMVESILTMGYYTDPAYSAVWSTLMMPVAGPPPAQFFAVSLLFGLITSLITVWAYHVVQPALAGLDWKRNGVFFGIFLFLVSTAPGIMSIMLLINLPAALLFAWLVSGFVISMADGLLLAKLC